MVISNPKLALAYTRNGGQIKQPVKAENADFVLFLGGTNKFPLVVPERFPKDAPAYSEDNPHLHDNEGNYHIGMILKQGKDAPYEWLSWPDTLVSTVACDDPVNRMLRLKTKPMGAHATIETRSYIGRFTDTARNPHLTDPEDAPKKLEKAILDAVKAVPANTTLDDDHAIDVDGLHFRNFVPAHKRSAKLDDLFTKMKEKISTGTRKNQLKGTDIQRCYFFFHDIGSGSSPRGDEYYKSEENAGEGSVNGFLNKNGKFGIQYDFDTPRGGTVLEHVPAGAWINSYCMGIETVPVVEADDTDDDLKFYSDEKNKKYASIGWYKKYRDEGFGNKHRDLWWKWPHKLLDTWAQLYVFCSARANHLLTISAHLEADKNLMYSSAFWDEDWKRKLDDTAIANAGTFMHRIAYKEETYNEKRKKYEGSGDQPGSMHDDPVAVDVQVLYDKITDQLNALGGLQLPKGVRYGIHRKRLLDFSRLDDAGLHGHGWGNGSNEMLTFPHQSSTTRRSSADYHKGYKIWRVGGGPNDGIANDT
jgi:hypothetical protein